MFKHENGPQLIPVVFAFGEVSVQQLPDDDGLQDGAEVNIHHTDPLNPDTDNDHLYDQSALRASAPQQAFPKGTSMTFGHGIAVVTAPWFYERTLPTPSMTDNLGETGWLAGDIQIPWRPETSLETRLLYPARKETAIAFGREYKYSVPAANHVSPSLGLTISALTKVPGKTWQLKPPRSRLGKDSDVS